MWQQSLQISMLSIFWKHSRNSDKTSSKLNIKFSTLNFWFKINENDKFDFEILIAKTFMRARLIFKETINKLYCNKRIIILLPNIYLRKSASVQPRTSLSKFGVDSFHFSIHYLDSTPPSWPSCGPPAIVHQVSEESRNQILSKNLMVMPFACAG